jgi:hypothetical protein
VRETDHLEQLGVVGMLVLNWSFKKQVKGAWTGLICLRIGNRWRAFMNAVMNLLVP